MKENVHAELQVDDDYLDKIVTELSATGLKLSDLEPIPLQNAIVNYF